MRCEIYQSYMEDWKESIPFEMNTNISYVYDCSFPEVDGIPMLELCLWMEESQSFPLYFCVQVEKSFIEMFEQTKIQHKIKHCTSKQFKNGYLVTVFEVTDSDQFKGIFPLLKVLSCMDDIVLWSTDKSCFSIGDELRTKSGFFTLVPIDIKVQEGHTAYYLPNAGTYLTIFSNDLRFSTFDKMSNLFPSSLVPILKK